MVQNFRMIDVGGKDTTRRRAVATGSIFLSEKTIRMIQKGESPKGNILSMAEVAGIMAAKNTPQILPLCHPLLIDSTRIWFEVYNDHVTAFCEVICSAKTGVEMEALVGVNACLLSIYDLAKAVDPIIEIRDVYLQIKEGGKSGVWKHPKVTSMPTDVADHQKSNPNLENVKIAVGTLSDRASKGIYDDKSGDILRKFFSEKMANEVLYKVIPDEEEVLTELLSEVCEKGVQILVLSGGTGLSSRDITPEVVKKFAKKELVGFGELQRIHGAKYTQSAWLSRSSAYVVQNTLVVLFPGSPKAVTQGLEAIGDLIPHALKMINGEGH